MKKTLLFVDDEAETLAQLERDFAHLSHLWTLAFARSGEEALARMAETPFDVVVADHHMPGMTGADLLNRIGEAHPATLRFIRSSFADKELMMTCVWGTHHFIPKPVDTATLVSTLQRALALEAWMGGEKIRGLVSRVHSVPSLPSVYFEVVRHLESPNATVEQIADAIGKDLAMTAKLLQMVNSAFFALPQKITSPSQAVLTLGMETVRSILLCIQVYSKVDPSRAGKLSLDRLWAHSLAVANAAKRITLHHTGDAKQADEAFTAGLLHDVGQLILSSNLGPDYDRVLGLAAAGSEPLWVVEEKELGASHAEVGAYLLGLWSMPVGLIEAAAFHHQPARGAATGFCPAVAVHVADVFVHERDAQAGQTTAVARLDEAALATMGFAGQIDAWRAVAHGQPVPAAAPPVVAPSANIAPVLPVVSGPPPQPARAHSLAWLWWGAPVAACLVMLVAVAAHRHSTRGAMVAAPATAAATEPLRDAGRPEVEIAPVEPPAVAGAEPTTEAESTEEEPRRVVLEIRPIPVPEPAPVLPPRRDNYRLQGIFFSAKRPSATINGQLVFAGDQVAGAEVVSIGRNSVLLSVQGETRELSLR